MSLATDIVLRGLRVTLRPFGIEQMTTRYLGWLNDPEVNRWSRRSEMGNIDEVAARAYLKSLVDDERILGIHLAGDGHIGNIKFGPIDWANSRTDISIVIGERHVWGRGVGAEAVYLVSQYLFETLGLNRLDAGSCNPAFVKMVQNIGWRVEGVLRERVRLGDQFYPYTILAQLRSEFARLDRFEVPYVNSGLS